MQDPEEHGKELAARCYHEDDGFLAKDKIAEWLGGQCVHPCCFGDVSLTSLLIAVRSTRLRFGITWIISTLQG